MAYLFLGQIGHAPLANKFVFHCREHSKTLAPWPIIGIFTKLNFLATPPQNDMVDFNGIKTFFSPKDA